MFVKVTAETLKNKTRQTLIFNHTIAEYSNRIKRGYPYVFLVFGTNIQPFTVSMMLADFF